LFDAGNTLVRIDPERMVSVYRDADVALDRDRFQEAELRARSVLHAGVQSGHKGTEPEVWRAYFERLFSLTGVPPAALDAVSAGVRREHAADHLWTSAVPGTTETLVALSEAGYRLGVVSNADGRMEMALERAGVRELVEFVIDSEAVGLEKPDPGIFEVGCEALGLPPEACVYVGDLYPVDYLGARAAGLQAVLVDPLGVHTERADTVPNLQQLPDWLDRRRNA
jgi:putative hydrolase of the HAD superfamily